MESAAYLLQKAAQCRRLAKSIVGDAASDDLIKLAAEFEAKAAEYLAHGKAAPAIATPRPNERWYNVYFRNKQGAIIGGDAFSAPDDEHAFVIARAVADACSDLCQRFEIWQSASRVDPSPEQTTPNADAIVTKVQGIVLERELVLGESRSAIASSARLLRETARLLQRAPS